MICGCVSLLAATLGTRPTDKLQVGGVPVRVEESKLGELQKDPGRNWTRIPESMGGGIAGYPEVFHQLHCLVSVSTL